MERTIAFLVFIGLQVAVNGAGLFALRDPNGRSVWKDDDAFDKKIQVWSPTLPTAQWRMLGQALQTDYDPLKQPLYRFRNQLENSKTPAIIQPEGFVWVWDDRVSRADKDVSIWKVTCPADYVALSDLFYPANRIVDPVNLHKEAACVRKELTEACPLGNKIWDDDGSGAWYDVGVWKVNSGAAQVEGGFFAAKSHNTPPEVSPRCLNKNSFVEL